MAELTSPRPTTPPPTKRRLRDLFGTIGPALVLATVVIGPGTLTLNTLAGSTYGYALLWVPLLATVFMVA